MQGHKTNNVRHGKMALLSHSLFVVTLNQITAGSDCFLWPTTSKVLGLIIRPQPLQTYNPVFHSLTVGSTSLPFSSHVKNPSLHGSFPHRQTHASGLDRSRSIN